MSKSSRKLQKLVRSRVRRLRVFLAERLAPADSRLVRSSVNLVQGRPRLDHSLVSVLLDLQDQLATLLHEQRGSRVAAGPFEGMPLGERSSWGDRSSKLLGCFESELHPAIEKGFSRGWDRVVNIGCAEGYYAVGLARRLPRVPVLAHDIEPDARRLTESLARASGVQAQVRVGGELDPASLCDALDGARRPFLLVDCEGAELVLMDPELVPALCAADIIIECHDFIDRSITSELRQRFENTHEIEIVRERTRDPRAIPELAELGSIEAALSVCEFRPERMHWLVLWSRAHAES